MNAGKILVAVGISLVAFGAGNSANAASTLRQSSVIELPGKPGLRFDYLKIDYKDHYLLSAHLGADQTYVIDLKTEKLLKTITDTPGAEGIEYVPELDKAYTSNWRDHTIGVINLKEMRGTKKIPAEQKPDGSAYAAPFHKLYVSDERAKALIVVDVVHDTVVTTLRFESETGMPQFDPVTKKIYLNLQDQNLFAEIDPATDTVLNKFPVGDCKGNHGMALDPDHHLAFLACEENDMVAVFNLDHHTVVAEFPVPSGIDVIAFDPGLGRLYSACYSGAISVVQEDDPSHFRKLEDFPVQPKVHSLAVDLETHKVYSPEQQENGQPASKLIIYEAVTQ
ncbi:MAG: YncE family protein [Bdellovibrionota bacterium]